VLDVAAGNGNATLAAARRWCDVTSTDYVRTLLNNGRDRAAAEKLKVEFREADAENLPFADKTFDVVMSTFGVMFTPDQDKAASELVRVCRPGGTIGLCSWTPQGKFGRFVRTVVTLLPPPPEGFRPPVLWGSEPHVRELLEPLGAELDMRRATLTMAFESPEAYLSHWEQAMAPVVTAKAYLGDEWPAAREQLLALFEDINERDDGTMAAEYEYLETIATA
jgi:ubiquinone/menaquinone biosynthesis C-methylase UbiE